MVTDDFVGLDRNMLCGMRILWGIAVGLLLVGCGLPLSREKPEPSREEVEGLSRDASAEAARRSAAQFAVDLSAAIQRDVPAMTPAGSGVSDSCAAGGHGEFGQADNYRLACDRSSLYAFTADGDLSGLLIVGDVPREQTTTITLTAGRYRLRLNADNSIEPEEIDLVLASTD
jgi:hypothetical protein